MMAFQSFIVVVFLQAGARQSSNRIIESLNGLLFGAGFFIFLALVFVTPIIIIILAYRHQKKRDAQRFQELQWFAQQNGWTFDPKATPAYFANSHAYAIFSAGHSKRMSVLVHKKIDDGQAFIFDYRFTRGHGKNSRTFHQTVIGFHSSRLNIPYFALYPESALGFIGEALGFHRDIDFPAFPTFSSRYTLDGENENAVRFFFNNQVLAYFENSATLHVDGGGSYIFAYISNKTFPAQSLPALVNDGLKILNLFRR